MPVHAWVGTLISFIQGSVGVKPTKNTPHLLLLGTPYLKGIGSWEIEPYYTLIYDYIPDCPLEALFTNRIFLAQKIYGS
ncbi:hypothetical protein MXB_1592 [Myxobolus squamalis]|nr:hypothetical protein MXB_1592 [Myxobolus squamalis]